MIAAPPEKVWAWVSDPRRAPRWNHNCKSVTPLDGGEPGPDWRYKAVFQLSGDPKGLDGVIETWEPNRRVVLKLKADPLSGAAVAREQFRLTPEKGGTRLEQRVDVERLPVPWWAALLIRFVRAFGAPQGPRMLETLRSLVEREL